MDRPQMIRIFRYWQLFLLVSFIANTARAQAPAISNIGDPAPPLRLRAWLKGSPVDQFEKGKVYVLEFWATWCKSCIASMPHLSAIANEYQGKATVIAVDVAERATTPIGKIKTFVDSMGSRMDLRVAAEDSNYMIAAWLNGTGEGTAIPKTIVVDSQGRLAWIGSPLQLGEVLPKIVNGGWDLKEALAARNEERRLTALNDSLSFELAACKGKPDSSLRMIAEIVRKEPKLEYASAIRVVTFNALLETDPHKACEYGRKLLSLPADRTQNAYFVYGAIEDHLASPNFPAEIFQLGAEACQWRIDNQPYPDIDGDAILYHRMAAFYWRTANKARAIGAEEKAVETLKGQSGSSAHSRLLAYESQLRRYKGDQAQ